MKREKSILIRLSNREQEIIKQRAEALEMTVSEYIRQAALGSITTRKENIDNEN